VVVFEVVTLEERMRVFQHEVPVPVLRALYENPTNERTIIIV
jgi:hypothetical protein